MSIRNLSPQQMFQQLAKHHQPHYRFRNWEKGFTAWNREAWPKVLATLGDFPDEVPLNPHLLAEWTVDKVITQRWIIDVSPHISATCLVNIPNDITKGERRPAILCCHGHGPHGKEAVMGNDSSPERRDGIAKFNYDYGRQMARLGYVTYAIDWIGFGERNDANKPHWLSTAGSRDWCNILYLHATMFGMTSLSINVAHGQRATDFVTSLDCVDGERLGVMGLSGGGTMTLWMALCDPRFKAIEIMCYSDIWEAFGMRDVNYCGMQVAPGLYKLVDLPDLQGLLAPRPLLIDIGANDTCFLVDTSLDCYRQLEAIYRAADALDNLELDFFAGEHAWGANKSESFFGRHLHVI